MTRTAKPRIVAAGEWKLRPFLALRVVALAYAFFAGLHTVTDWDLGWQLATGRWVAQHHAIPSTEVFSYTAHGAPWIYPIGSGLFFYFAYLLGHYALLSWIGAAACVGTVALLLRRGSAVSALLAILSIPLIADRTTPRADMFTVVLFTAFLTLLWHQHDTSSALQRSNTGRTPLWLLPLLMVAWVNLHLGFLAGLGLIAAFVLVEVLDLFWPELRHDAVERLRHSWLWLLATFAAVLANPWGWRIGQALLRQESAMSSHSQEISEWASVRLNWTALTAALTQRDPKSATFFILLFVTMMAVPVALWRRQIGAAALLSCAAVLAFQHERFGALFGLIVTVVAGAVLTPAIRALGVRIKDQRLRSILVLGFLCAATALTCARSVDLITDRTYLGGSTELGSFGTGLSWWFPEGAAEFIERENIPGQVFNSYNEGGFLVWKLGPKYSDYIDGRAIPFGSELFTRSAVLMAATPESPQWRQEAERYDIHTIIIPLARYGALQYFPVLRQFCASDEWRPVYLDEVSVVFVRRRPETESLISRRQIDCSTAPLPSIAPADKGSKAFNHWANAAAVLYALGRNSEAFAATSKALDIFPGSTMIHILRGNMLAQTGNRGAAEQEYLVANGLESTGYSWATLAVFYGQQGRLAEKIDAWKHVASLAPVSTSSAVLLALGNSYLEAHQPQEALQTFDEAAGRLPRPPTTDGENKPILAELAHGRALAWAALGDMDRAVSCEEEAVGLVPSKSDSWTMLADLYDRQGRHDAAQWARAQLRSRGK
jgi:Flp pilus assembly protein TadD